MKLYPRYKFINVVSNVNKNGLMAVRLLQEFGLQRTWHLGQWYLLTMLQWVEIDRKHCVTKLFTIPFRSLQFNLNINTKTRLFSPPQMERKDSVECMITCYQLEMKKSWLNRKHTALIPWPKTTNKFVGHTCYV